jgi:hypothetical protein
MAILEYCDQCGQYWSCNHNRHPTQQALSQLLYSDMYGYVSYLYPNGFPPCMHIPLFIPFAHSGSTMTRRATRGLVSVIAWKSCASKQALLELRTASLVRGIISLSYLSTGPGSRAALSNNSLWREAISAIPWFAASPLTLEVLAYLIYGWKVGVQVIFDVPGSKHLHMVMACAASPTSVILPPALSHSPLLGGQSSSAMGLASIPAGISCTILENGSAHPLANFFIQLSLSSLLSETSVGNCLPRNPAR